MHCVFFVITNIIEIFYEYNHFNLKPCLVSFFFFFFKTNEARIRLRDQESLWMVEGHYWVKFEG